MNKSKYKKTPSQEVLDVLKESLKDYYVINRDGILWGKKGEIVKHIGDFGTPNRMNSSWTNADGSVSPLVACGLQHCIYDGTVITLFDHLQFNKTINVTKLVDFMKSKIFQETA